MNLEKKIQNTFPFNTFEGETKKQLTDATITIVGRFQLQLLMGYCEWRKGQLSKVHLSQDELKCIHNENVEQMTAYLKSLGVSRANKPEKPDSCDCPYDHVDSKCTNNECLRAGPCSKTCGLSIKEKSEKPINSSSKEIVDNSKDEETAKGTDFTLEDMQNFMRDAVKGESKHESRSSPLARELVNLYGEYAEQVLNGYIYGRRVVEATGFMEWLVKKNDETKRND